MTTQRSFKRLVRSRMEKTGESYTAARAQLLAGDEPQRISLATSDETIRERTGRGWEEWFDLLDEWGAADKTHREIARWLAGQQGIHPLAWNAQAIAGSYERTRRGRQVGEHEDGFTVTATKTVAVPVERLYDAFVDASLRERWLPGGDAARAHRHEAALGPLRLGRERQPRPRRLRRQGRGEEHRRACRTSGSPTARRRSA